MPENLVSRDGFSRPVPRQPAHLHTQAESGAYLRDSTRVPRRRPFMKYRSFDLWIECGAASSFMLQYSTVDGEISSALSSPLLSSLLLPPVDVIVVIVVVL